MNAPPEVTSGPPEPMRPGAPPPAPPDSEVFADARLLPSTAGSAGRSSTTA